MISKGRGLAASSALDTNVSTARQPDSFAREIPPPADFELPVQIDMTWNGAWSVSGHGVSRHDISGHSISDQSVSGESERDWDDVVLLPRADVRLRSNLSYALSRGIWWSRGKRHLAVASLAASCALLAACASAVRTVPNAPSVALASNDGRDAIRLPASVPPLRSGRPQTARAPKVETAANEAPDAQRPEAETVPPRYDAADASPPDDAPSAAPAQTSPWPSILRGDTSSERPITKLVAFRSAPFPYSGTQPGGGAFLNVSDGEHRGHRGRRGQILWESKTFNDNHVLVHIPPHFDPDRPAVMVIFFHGYGATLSRDVAARQEVPAQVSASGANAVLVAPQFAVDARDPSIGHFWEPGGFSRFLRESAQQLARASGNPASAERFAHMPIVIVAYSGGFYSAAFCLKDLGESHRVRGILMLDAAYGEFERYANWAADNRSSFLVSGYTHFTARQNAGLKAMLAARGVPVNARLTDSLTHGGATFLSADSSHNDYVTQAWTEDPIRDILMRLPEVHMRDPQAIASVDMTPTASIH